jgi:hypothetical protein
MPDHCVEYIREYVMCSPDLSPVTFQWINDTAQHENKDAFYPTNLDISMHRCVNWDSLESWADQKSFDLFRLDLLERPGDAQ